MVYRLDRKRIAKRFGPCVRYGSMDQNESHPCFFCGFPIPVTMRYCKCGIVKCPGCKGCACTLSDKELLALLKLRDKYCCNAYNFAKNTIEDCDEYLLKLVPGYLTAISYCRAREAELV